VTSGLWLGEVDGTADGSALVMAPGLGAVEATDAPLGLQAAMRAAIA